MCLEVVGSDDLQHRTRYPGLVDEPRPNRRWWDPTESLKYSVRLGSKKFTLILADEDSGGGACEGYSGGSGSGGGRRGIANAGVSRSGSRDGGMDVEQGLWENEDEEYQDRAAVGQWARRGSGDDQDGPRWQFNVTSEAIRRSGSGVIRGPAAVTDVEDRTPGVANSVDSLKSLESFCGDVETALEEGGLLGRKDSGAEEDTVESAGAGEGAGTGAGAGTSMSSQVVFKEPWEEKENRLEGRGNWYFKAEN